MTVSLFRENCNGLTTEVVAMRSMVNIYVVRSGLFVMVAIYLALALYFGWEVAAG